MFGAELSLGLATRVGRGPGGRSRATSRPGLPDPEGEHLLVLARDPEGYRRLCQVISAAQLAAGEKGRPGYDARVLADAHDGHWVVLTGCRKGAVPAALATSGPGAAAAKLRTLTDTFGAANVMVELASHDEPADDERNDALYAAGAGGWDRRGGHRERTLRGAAADPPGAGAGLGPGPAQPGGDGRLAARLGSAYLRTGAEMAARLRRYPGVQERTVELALDCAFDFQVIAPELPDFPVPAATRRRPGFARWSRRRPRSVTARPPRSGWPGYTVRSPANSM